MLGPGRDSDALGPCSVGTSTVCAADGLEDRDRDLDLEVLALALEDGRLGHAGDRVEVAGRAAARPGLALARPDGRGCRRARRRGCSPGSASFARRPGAVARRARVLDLGAGAAALRARLGDREQPLARRLDAAPLAARADLRCVPGRAPVPWQVGHGADSGTATGTCAPSIACSNEMCTSVSRSRPRSGRGAPPAPPAPPNRSERMSPKPTPKPLPPAGGKRGVEAAERGRRPVVLLALLGIAHQVVGRLDLLEALLGGRSPWLRSGWYWRASLRYAFLISSYEAFLSTPRPCRGPAAIAPTRRPPPGRPQARLR